MGLFFTFSFPVLTLKDSFDLLVLCHVLCGLPLLRLDAQVGPGLHEQLQALCKSLLGRHVDRGPAVDVLEKLESNRSQFGTKLEPNGTQMGPKWDPNWTQIGTKSEPNGSQMGAKWELK